MWTHRLRCGGWPRRMRSTCCMATRTSPVFTGLMPRTTARCSAIGMWAQGHRAQRYCVCHRTRLQKLKCRSSACPPIARKSVHPGLRIDIVDLPGVQKLLGVTQVHPLLHKDIEQVGVDMATGAELVHDAHGL